MQLFLSVIFAFLLVIFVNGSEEKLDLIYRLSDNVQPTHYDLQLKTASHMGNVTFRGSVKIHVIVLDATEEIVLHCAAVLNVSDVKLYRENGSTVTNLVVESDRPNQYLTVKSADELLIGNYVLRMDFHLADAENTPEDGIYVFPYSGDSDRFYLFSRFEPTYARAVFPCFDEAVFKSTFSLKMTHHRSQTADSNMPLEGPPEQSEDDPELVVSSFERTPVISTHMLTFVVSDLVPLDANANHTMKALPDVVNETYFALQTAKQVLAALDEYTSIPYSSFVPKLTHMLIPGFSHAVQNWGLVVYNDRTLRVNEQDGNSIEQRIAMSQVGYQLAHMWFGNLVSPWWWNAYWITEGLSMLYSAYALHLVHPTAHWMEWFRVVIVSDTMRGSPAEAITHSCITKWDVQALDTNRAYPRAAAVLDMFRQIVTDDKWQLIMRTFLRKHEFMTVDEHDFYLAIENALEGTDLFSANRTVQRTLDSWVTNKGTPMVVVERLYNESKIKLSQYKMKPVLEVGNESWVIPYDYAYESGANFDQIGPIHWLTESSEVIDTVVSAYEWIVLNKLQFGFYRINYDTTNWNLIARALRSNVSCMHRMNRAQLLGDAFYFVEFGQLDKNTSFDMVGFLADETESIVWHVAFPIMRLIESELGGVEYQNYFQIMLRNLTDRYYNKMATELAATPSTFDRSMRRMITYMACRAGNEQCLHDARLAFGKSHQANSVVLPADEATAVFCFGLRGATDEEFSWLMARFEQPANQKRLIGALGCANRSEHLRQVIERVHELIEDSSLHEQRNFQPEFVGGLRTEMGEAQFWRLSQLLHNETLVDMISLTVLQPVMDVMLSRIYSAKAAAVGKKLHDDLKAKYSHLWMNFDGKYPPEVDTREYYWNGLVENYVRDAGLI